ncbi:hypothetical protein [Actinomadura sp. SCN-SB]|uniref:hypothetical protein n=1 Tax=Actinomadura sp. SCN-SB TaxID=3373092 RepID=UPI003753B25D
MIFLGLVVAVAAVAAGAAVVLENTESVELVAFGGTVPGITEEWHVFMAGAVVAITLMAGLAVAILGMRRSLEIRRELRDLRDEHEESLQTLEMEKRQLEQELAQVRRNMPPPLPSSTS